MIRLYRAAGFSSPQEVFNFPTSPLPVRWGEKGPAVSFVLALTGEALYLGGEFKQTPWLHSNPVPGRFREGLWERDVLELFLSSQADQRYQEFNLSPAGEWWSCLFTSPRQRADSSLAGLPAEVYAAATGDLWRVILEITPAICVFDLGRPDDLRMNICACLGKERRSYLSAVNLPGDRPDFHQPQYLSMPSLSD